MPEKPREAYKAACADLAELLVPQGFVPSRQNQQFDRVVGEVMARIHTQLSSKGIAGEHVIMTVWVLVGSTRLRDFLASRTPLVGHPEGWLGGGLLAHVTEPRSPFTDFNIATPALRQAAIARIRALYESKAVPYFAQIGEVEALARHLAGGDRPTFDDRMIDWLLSHDRRDEALAHGRFILERGGPRVKTEYAQALAELRRIGLPTQAPAQTYGTTVAIRAVLYDLDF